MKITSSKEFAPCSVIITFSSQEELDKMTALFNSGKVTSSLNLDATGLWSTLNNLGGSSEGTTAFHEELMRKFRDGKF